MSDPEKTRVDTEENISENNDESDYFWSDVEEGEIREIVLALPALSLRESPNVDEATRQEAVAAADLMIAAAEEAAVTEGNMEQGVGGSGGTTASKKKARRPRTVKLDDLADMTGASSGSKAGEEEPAKKPRKKGSSKLINPPEGPPICNVCGRSFISWKAVFGHLRSHRDRGYFGFLPPPTFNAAVEASGGAAAASYGGGGIGLGTGGLHIDLNADPIDDEEETGTGFTPKFDLNRSPPQDEDETKEDKAE